MNECCTIGIDLGGTRIKAVAINDEDKIIDSIYQPTDDGDDQQWKKTIFDTVQSLVQKLNATNILVGISAPGLPNETNTAIVDMPGRLQGLEHFSWSDYLKHPAYVLNDAIAALMGEAGYGAARNKNNVVMLTLGTGVGGAILIDGKPYQGFLRKAGHFGHMVITGEGEIDVTGMPGSLEVCIGNYTVKERSAGKFESTKELLGAVRANDAFANEIWLRSVKHLAMGIASISNMLAPELMILGGGITEAGDDLLIPLRKMVSNFEWQPEGKGIIIEKAMLGDMAGAIGAARFAKQQLQ